MSYSLDVKKGLLPLEVTEEEQKAELYGFLLFSNTVSSDEIRIYTAYPEIRARYLNFLIAAGVRKFSLSCQGKTVKKYVCRITSRADMQSLSDYFGEGVFDSPLRIRPDAIGADGLVRAFLRGVFMANGVAVAPDKNASVEFKTGHHTLGKELFDLFQTRLDLLPGTSERNGKVLVYFKSADSIRDFFALIGATDAMYDFANREIEHACRSAANRRFNCDNANIQRSVDAAGNQIAAIRKLLAANVDLPLPLAEIARLRAEYPDETLTALGQRCNPPISKAGAAHRLKKICDLADRIGGE